MQILDEEDTLNLQKQNSDAMLFFPKNACLQLQKLQLPTSIPQRPDGTVIPVAS